MAKAKKKSTDEIPAPKRRRRRKATLVKKARRRRAVREASSFTTNPAAMADLVEFILPSFAGYGASRLLSRIAYVQLSGRFPKAAKHITAGSTVATAALVWLLAHRIKRFEKYHTPLIIGSSIAALQTLVQTYLPKFGWMVSDYLEGPAAADTKRVTASGPQASLTAADDEDDDFADVLSPDEHLGVLSVPTLHDDADDDESVPDDFDD